MAIVASAPGRVNLIGEHTDYNGGRCLPFAIELRTTVSVTPRTDDVILLRSNQDETDVQTRFADLQPGAVSGWGSYPLGVLWALVEDGWKVRGVEIDVDSDIPLGVGLSSSAALECAVATAMAALHDGALDRTGRRHLAELCVRAETEFVGAPTGGMDQTTAMLATAGQALLLDFAEHTERAVPLPLRAAGLTVLVIDTGTTHTLAEGGGYADRRSECTAAAHALDVTALCAADPAAVEELTNPTLRARARHAVSEGQRVEAAVAAITAQDWQELGRLLTASHASLRDDFEVSTPELDHAVSSAVAAGALGARLVGGGFGGSAIALTATAEVAAVCAAVDAAFSSAGHAQPTFHQVAPAAGAAVHHT